MASLKAARAQLRSTNEGLEALIAALQPAAGRSGPQLHELRENLDAAFKAVRCVWLCAHDLPTRCMDGCICELGHGTASEGGVNAGERKYDDGEQSWREVHCV